MESLGLVLYLAESYISKKLQPKKECGDQFIALTQLLLPDPSKNGQSG